MSEKISLDSSASQNYLCIGEHTLCPFFKARFFGFKLLIWMRLIIMS